MANDDERNLEIEERMGRLIHNLATTPNYCETPGAQAEIMETLTALIELHTWDLNAVSLTFDDLEKENLGLKRELTKLSIENRRLEAKLASAESWIACRRASL